jgi:methylated-DNA-[protein]-cysteine S-methyltransferase
MMSGEFRKKVLKFVSSVPPGTVVTYREVAVAAGNPRAARAVGTILKQNRDVFVPCHRVVRSDMSVGGYNGLRGTGKLRLLRSEGIKFNSAGFIQ